MSRIKLLGVIALAAVCFYQADILLVENLALRLSDIELENQKDLISRGVLGYWSLDESVPVNQVSCKKAINAGTTLVNGKYGKGRWFHGRPHNSLYIDSDFRQLKEAYTISFWIKIDRSQEDCQYILKNHTGRVNFIWLEKDQLHFRMIEAKTSSKILSYPFKQYGKFVHIALTFSLQSRQACVYENGVLMDREKVISISHRPEKLLLGQYKGMGVLNYILDEVMIRNYVMGEEEIRKESQAKEAYPYRINKGRVLLKKIMEEVRKGLQRIIKSLDLLNPYYGRGRVLKADLPEFHLYLSKKDKKAFNRYHYLSLKHGIVPKEISKTRKIEIEVGGVLEQAQMELCGDAGRLSRYGKKTFSIELGKEGQYQGMNKIIFVPPEENGLLRALFKKYLEKKYHCLGSQGGLGVVWINREYQGLYYYEDAGFFAYEGQVHEAWQIEEFLKKLPISKTDVLREYDELRKRYGKLLMSDHTAPMGSREILYGIKQDRKRIRKMNLEEYEKEDKKIVEKVREYFKEEMVLGENPGRECVLWNLDFSVKEIDGVRINWRSKKEEFISHEGKINRLNEEEPKTVEVEVSFAKGDYQTQKIFHFTVMPVILKMNVLAVWNYRRAGRYIYSPCLVEFIDANKNIKSKKTPAKIRLQGNSALGFPKKSYKIRLGNHAFLDFHPLSSLILMSSYYDISFIKNKFAYDVSRLISKSSHFKSAPKHDFTEFFINGEFRGIYEFSEDVSAEMLGLRKYQKGEKNHSVLYKAEVNGANFERFSQDYYLQQYPHLEHGEYWAPYYELISFLGQSSDAVFERRAKEVLDVENVMHFQILTTLINQEDGGEGHNLFIARNSGPNEKFFIIAWDYDRSLDGPIDQIWTNHLFNRLMKLPFYKKALCERWKELRKDILSEKSLMKQIDDIENKIKYRVKRNFELWPLPPGITREREITQKREWIKKRLVFLDEYFSNLVSKG